MIIDLISQKKNQIRCSFYDNINSYLKKNYYSLKTNSEATSWKVERNIASVSYTIISPDISYLREILFDVNGTYSNMIIEYSIDYINWYDLEFVSLNNEIYKKIDNKYINLETFEQIDYDINMKYIFKKQNKYTKEYEYVYSNFPFKFIRFTFKDVVASKEHPLKFNQLSVFIDEEFNDTYLNKSILSVRCSSFYSLKSFENNDFFPDLISNFSKMLEVNNNQNYCKDFETTKLQNSVVSIENITL